MQLGIRMVLYYVFAAVGGLGVASWDPGAATLTVSVEQATAALLSVGGFAATFAWSRVAKSRGGTT